MAKAKSKSDIKITSIKKNNVVVKKGAKTASVNRKPRPPKKKLEIADEIKKEDIKETEIVKKNNGNVASKLNEKKELTQEEVIAQRKERNRKKYQNQQKKYQENKRTKDKKKIVVEDQVDDKLKKSDTVKEEDLIKKVKEKKEEEFSNKEKERKEKRKTNRKPIQLTQTLTSIKEKSVTRISNVRERVDDKHIPVGKTQEEKIKRSKRLIKESIVYAIILTIIDIACILIFDYFNFLRLFDVKALNIVVTVLIALIFNFFVAFMIDYFVTEIWLKKKRKKDGEQDGDNRAIEEEHRENIENKEGE